MNKLAQRLIKDSLINRNWIVLANYTRASNVNFSQDSLATRRSDESFETDRETRFTSNDIAHFIKRIELNSAFMNKDEAVATLSKLYVTARDQRVKVDLGNIDGFEHMCNVIRKEARSLNTYNIVRMLSILTFFNIPSRTSIVSTLLQLLTTSLDKLSIGQLITVHAILSKMEPAPNIENLQKAVAVVFKKKAEDSIDSQTPNLLKVLRFCIVINDEKTLNHMINILLANKGQINENYIVDIYRAICALPKLSQNAGKLLYIIHNMISSNAKNLQVYDIVELLRYMSNQVAQSRTDFYNEEAISALTKVLLSSYASNVRQKFFALGLFNKMQYSYPMVIDHMANVCLEDTKLSNNMKENETTFINACVIADYKPLCWKKIEELLTNHIALQDCSMNNATSIAFRMLSLGSYQPELVEKVFKLFNSISRIPKSSLLSISRLYWCVNVLYPDYKGITLDENKVNELNQFLSEMKRTSNLPDLRERLQTAAGGAEYIMSGLKTKFGEFVDVVVVQPDGALMDVSSCDNITFIDELTSLPNSTKILFFDLPKEAFSINYMKPISTVRMLLESVETLPGCTAFAIHPHKWKTFLNKDKVSHLQSVIKSKSSSSSNSTRTN